MNRFKASSTLIIALNILTSSQPLLAQTKVGCKSVAATEAACTDYANNIKACADLVQAEGKKKLELAKQEQNTCKTKNGAVYMMKCKDQIKAANTLAHMPKALLNSNVEKEQTAIADTPCAKAEATGKEHSLCKGPKKVIEAMKATCIKDM